MKIDLIVFDCDGVLVDSEFVAHKSRSEVMTSIGFPLTIENSIEVFSGIADADLPYYIEKQFGKTITDEGLQVLTSKVLAALKKDTLPISGVNNVMNYLEKNALRKCIASNSSPDYLNHTLKLTGLDGYFSNEHVFSADMVPHRKPKPDVFLHAAKQMGVNAENCLVVEDSYVGVTAAKAAGMQVVGFLGGSHAKSSWYHDKINELQPTYIAKSTDELLKILSEL